MLSRRRLLDKTVGALGLALMPLETQLASAQTTPTAPAKKRLIVDAQVHLWTAETPDHPWIKGRTPQLPEPFTVDKLLPLMRQADVDRVVVVPPSWPGDRNDDALAAAQKYPTRFGIMGRIPLEKPASAALLPKWKEQPGMLGLRLTFLGPEARWLADGTADWFWPAAEKAGLPVMVLATRMSELAPIAAKHPHLTLIVDHMGLSGEVVKAGNGAELVKQTVALAKYENVSVKLSGYPAYSSEPYPFRDMTTYIKSCFDAYGPQRCYWGSDITNSLTKATYRQRIDQFENDYDFLSADDKDWIMGRAILARLGWN